MSITLSILASLVLMVSAICGVSMALRSPRWNSAGIGWLLFAGALVSVYGTSSALGFCVTARTWLAHIPVSVQMADGTLIQRNGAAHGPIFRPSCYAGGGSFPTGWDPNLVAQRREPAAYSHLTVSAAKKMA